jgi:hypothetical protein
MCDVESVYQRFKLGAEFDQFGISRLRGRQGVCWDGDSNGAADCNS